MILLFIGIVIHSYEILAQTTPAISLRPYRKGSKWGYSDINKKIVIPCIYDETYPFDSKTGLAPVTINNKWGFVNAKGKQVIPLIYDSVLSR